MAIRRRSSRLARADQHWPYGCLEQCPRACAIMLRRLSRFMVSWRDHLQKQHSFQIQESWIVHHVSQTHYTLRGCLRAPPAPGVALPPQT